MRVVMKTFSCGSVVPGCTAHFTASTDEGILEQVAHHAREDHGLTDIPAELVSRVRANIA
jgi:predicted small metal-binding protein